MIRFIEELTALIWWFVQLAAEAFYHLLMFSLRMIEAFSRLIARIYLGIEAYIRKLVVRLVWLLFQLLLLAIVMSPAIAALVTYFFFWGHRALIPAAVLWACFLFMTGLVMFGKMEKEGRKPSLPTQEDYIAMESWLSTVLVMITIRSLPGILLIVYALNLVEQDYPWSDKKMPARAQWIVGAGMIWIITCCYPLYTWAERLLKKFKIIGN
jgi:hypothetical protein